jgi:hypothetical protein
MNGLLGFFFALPMACPHALVLPFSAFFAGEGEIETREISSLKTVKNRCTDSFSVFKEAWTRPLKVGKSTIREFSLKLGNFHS